MTSEIAGLKELLKLVEFVKGYETRGEIMIDGVCHICGGIYRHFKDCKLKKALEE